MRNKQKISATLIALLLMLLSMMSHAQEDAERYTKIKSKITIGFQTNRSLLISLYKPHNSKAYKTTSLLVRIPVTGHLQFETGLTTSTLNKFSFNTYPNTGRPAAYDLSIPASLQYHFLPKSRVRPYLGVGLFYNFNPSLATEKNKELILDPRIEEPGLQYINIFFTQGVIFEINTRIQVNQSFHFIPGSGQKTLGISLGVGFTLP